MTQPIACALPNLCPCCGGKAFVYLSSWRYMYPRGEGPQERQTDAYVCAQEAAGTRMIIAMPQAANAMWSSPKQLAVPVSLRGCTTCGALQPYVAPSTLRALADGNGSDAVYVDDEPQRDSPFR